MQQNIKKNIFSSIFLQIITFVSGLILPRLTLLYFGSEVNGLVSSLNQFLSFITLFEGGLGSVVLASLYKPLAKKDYHEISEICKSSNVFFFQLSFAFIIYSVILAIIYPIAVKSSFDFWYIFWLTLILSLNLVIQYYFSITNRLLLEADNKGYYVYLIQSLAIILMTVVSVIIIPNCSSIHVVKFVRAISYTIQPILLFYFVKKIYTLPKVKYEKGKYLDNRWDGFIQNFAFFIHSNTDIVILTFFGNLKDVSVYSTYSMIIMGIQTLTMSVKNGFLPSIGNSIANNSKMDSIFDEYEYSMYNVATLLFGCTIFLITPFVDLYTNGINDANYHQPMFALVLCLAELFYCIREPYISIAYADNKFKETNVGSIFEVVVNIVLSLLLVTRFNLLGVAIGTLVAMIVRMIFHINFLKKNIIYRPIKKSLFRISILTFSLVLMYIENVMIKIPCDNLITWIIRSISLFVIFALTILAVNYIFDKEKTNTFVSHFFNRIK